MVMIVYVAISLPSGPVHREKRPANIIGFCPLEPWMKYDCFFAPP